MAGNTEHSAEAGSGTSPAAPLQRHLSSGTSPAAPLQRHLSSGTSPAAPRKQNLANLVIRFSNATVLCIAALMKIWWVATSQTWEVEVAYPSYLVIFAFCSELFVAIELAADTRYCFRLAAVLHFILLVIGLTFSFLNVPCNCFGEESPVQVISMGNCVLVILLLKADLSNSNVVEDISTQSLGCRMGLVLGIAVILSVYLTTDARDQLGVSSSPVRSQPANIGAVKPNTEIMVILTLTNSSSSAINIIGGRASCNCIVNGTYPIELPPNSLNKIPIKVRVQQRRQQSHDNRLEVYHQYVTFVLDSPKQINLRADIFGEVETSIE